MSRTLCHALRRNGCTDYYPTPAWAVHRLFDRLPHLTLHRSWLEPCAGDLAIVEAAQQHVPRAWWTTADLRWSCPTDYVLDFTDTGQVSELRSLCRDDLFPSGVWDVCISNPPYSRALPIIESALSVADNVVMLLPLSFLASAERREWHQLLPAHLVILPDRPSFDGVGSDANDYAWFWWTRARQSFHAPHGRSYDFAKLTPREERRRDAARCRELSGRLKPAGAWELMSSWLPVVRWTCPGKK